MPIKNYKQRLASLQGRRTDPLLRKSNVTEMFSRESVPETVKYVFESMDAIDGTYTANTYAESERVKNQITKNLEDGVAVSFDFQGSVPLNTHIKLHSDLDILTIMTNFSTLEPPQKPAWPYLGDPVADLRNLRQNIYKTLSKNFPEADVDNNKAKAVSICNGSLLRKFDIIVANWYDTNAYLQSNSKKDRGLNIYDKKENKRIKDYPFSHMATVQDKANNTFNDNFRRLIRLMKTLKVDANTNIGLSSFLITSVFYHMADSHFTVSGNRSTALLINASRHLEAVIKNSVYRQSLNSPNGKESLFAVDEDLKVIEFKKLKGELDDTIVDLGEELRSQTRFFADSNPWGLTINEALEKAVVNYKQL